MAALAGNWPNTQIGADTGEVWYQSVLSDLTFERGLAIVMQLVEREQWFPTVAKFYEYQRALARTDLQQAALPEAPANPADVRTTVARIRRMLADMGPCWGTIEKPRRMPPEERRHTAPSYSTCDACQAAT